MPFGRSKTPHRTPLQRLNDQRRSVVLAGLAGGAAVAAIFRRRKGGGETELGEPMPAPVTSERVAPPVPAAQPEPVAPPEPAAAPTPVDSGPPAEPEVPPAAEPLPADDPPAAGAAEPPAREPSNPLVDPATGELSAEEASILAVLAQSGRSDDDRTAIAVATSLERETTDVAAVLRKLGAEGVVSGELYTASGDKIWAVTERGVRRLGAQH